jgi:hypothetical protein
LELVFAGPQSWLVNHRYVCRYGSYAFDYDYAARRKIMYTFVAAVTFFAVLIAVLFMAVWAAIRMAEEKGRTEGESDLRKAQQDDARRRLENAMAADSKSRADSASGKLREDDGHRRD